RFSRDWSSDVCSSDLDDALVLLRRQSYGVVLLDEQMPGTRGLDLIPHLRAIDASMPLVMVTKSEEAGTMRDAIGAEIADYLIKQIGRASCRERVYVRG